MPKYHITGRIRVDAPIDEKIEAINEETAIQWAENIFNKKIGIHPNEILDSEIYCDEIPD